MRAMYVFTDFYRLLTPSAQHVVVFSRSLGGLAMVSKIPFLFMKTAQTQLRRKTNFVTFITQ